MTPPTCTTCGAAFDVGRRRTQESVDKAAADAGWLLGWPLGRMYCPDHHPERKPR